MLDLGLDALESPITLLVPYDDHKRGFFSLLCHWIFRDLEEDALFPNLLTSTYETVSVTCQYILTNVLPPTRPLLVAPNLQPRQPSLHAPNPALVTHFRYPTCTASLLQQEKRRC